MMCMYFFIMKPCIKSLAALYIVLYDSHHKDYNIHLFILPLTHLYKHLTLRLGCLYKHRHYV